MRNMYEYKLDLELDRITKMMEMTAEEDAKLLAEIRQIGQEGLGDSLSDKERNFIERKIQQFLKTESALTAAVSAVQKVESKTLGRLQAVSGVRVDKDRFAEMIGSAIVPYETFRKRPGMYAMINKTFSSVTEIMREPADRNNPVGTILTGVIRRIEDAGFRYTGAGFINTSLIHLNLFELTDAGRPRAGTMKELGYTPDRVLEIAAMFTGNKKPGYLRALWLAYRAEFYRMRFLWDLIAGRSEDEINRFDGIEIRSMRLGIIKAISLHQNWRQCVKDLRVCNRLLSFVSAAADTGYETLNFMAVEPNQLLSNSSLVEAEEVVTADDIIAAEPEEEKSYHDCECTGEELKASLAARESMYYPSDGVRAVALETLRADEARYNKHTTRTMLNARQSDIEKNKHLLACLENVSILLGREVAKMGHISKQQLDTVIVRNIPKRDTMNNRVVFYNGIRQDYTTSIAALIEPVVSTESLGSAIETYLKMADSAGFEINDADAMFANKVHGMKLFDTDYTRFTGTVGDAGYTAADILRFAKSLDAVQQTMQSPFPVANGQSEITHRTIEDAILRANSKDSVDRISASAVRRKRYGVLSKIRGELLLSEVLKDTFTIYRIIKALNAKKN